jgi:group I intron endonuclease
MVAENPDIRTLASPINKKYWAVAGIYGICNLLNGKWYVGSSTNIFHRLLAHRARLKAGDHPNPHLQSSFKKYGINAFTCEVLQAIHGTKEKLLALEETWIGRLSALMDGYNLREDASSNAGMVMSKETRIKMSKSRKAYLSLLGVRDNIRRTMLSLPSEVVCRGLRGRTPWNKGMKMSDEFRRKVSVGHMGQVISDENKNKLRQRLLKSPINAPVTYTFTHPVHGLRSGVNVLQFCQQWNLPQGDIMGVRSGRLLSCRGWTLECPRVKKKMGPSAGYFKIIDLIGNIHEGHGIRDFARTRGLNPMCMNNLRCGQLNQYAGWKLISRSA